MKADLYRKVRRLDREAIQERRTYQARGFATRRWREIQGPFWRKQRLQVLRSVAGAKQPALKQGEAA